MEEDIKILENKIKRSRELNEEVGVHIFFNEDLINIVEKLIKAYKEKEESEKYLYDAYQDAGKKMFEYSEELEELKKNQCTHNIDNECIRKSKVKEMIENRQKRIEDIRSNLYINQASLFELGKLETEIIVLQQLLEKGDK